MRINSQRRAKLPDKQRYKCASGAMQTVQAITRTIPVLHFGLGCTQKLSNKIAVVSSDSENINENFGSAKNFVIYEVSDGCGSGCRGYGEPSAKVEIISDCRAVVCKKIGFHIRKQLERKAISAFDVSCKIDEVLDKITFYYNRIDRH